MADGGGLENRYGVKPIVGSNPTPSAPISGLVFVRPGVGLPEGAQRPRRASRVSVRFLSTCGWHIPGPSPTRPRAPRGGEAASADVLIPRFSVILMLELFDRSRSPSRLGYECNGRGSSWTAARRLAGW